MAKYSVQTFGGTPQSSLIAAAIDPNSTVRLDTEFWTMFGAALRPVMLYYRRVVLPGKFKQNAAARYGMHKRHPAYMRAKMIRYYRDPSTPSNLYLVWSGRTMRMVSNTRGRRTIMRAPAGGVVLGGRNFRGGSFLPQEYRVDVTLEVPGYFATYNRNGMNLWDELTRTDDRDNAAMADILLREVAGRL